MNDSGAFHRPPRSFPPALPKDKIVVARPPTLNRRGVGTFVQMILPVLGRFGIVAFAIIMPNKLFLIVAGVFVAIAVFSVVASHSPSGEAASSRPAPSGGCIARTSTSAAVGSRS